LQQGCIRQGNDTNTPPPSQMTKVGAVFIDNRSSSNPQPTRSPPIARLEPQPSSGALAPASYPQTLEVCGSPALSVSGHHAPPTKNPGSRSCDLPPHGATYWLVIPGGGDAAIAMFEAAAWVLASQTGHASCRARCPCDATKATSRQAATGGGSRAAMRYPF
jgi:hypothetical protein